MIDTFDDAKVFINCIEDVVNAARLQRIYDEIEAEYDRQYNIEPRGTQDAPAEHLERFGIELTPMLRRSAT